MKKAILAVFCVLIIIIFILSTFTLYGRAIRQTEINNAMTLSMESAMDMLLLDEGRPETEEEWEAMFLSSVAVQIESESELKVHIIESDMQKGILSAEGILIFKHPIGTIGSVSSGKMDIILEEYTAE